MAFTQIKEMEWAYNQANEDNDPNPKVPQAMIDDFQRCGGLIVRGLFKAEASKLLEAVKSVYEKRAFAKKSVPMSLWSKAGDDIVGKATGNSKNVGLAEQLMGKGEMYLYHGKCLVKHPSTEGNFSWHQDYGYWYYNGGGIPYPYMLTTITALTKSDSNTGGVRILKGSNQCGRMDHARHDAGVGMDQMGVTPDRVQLMKQLLPEVNIDLEAGDTFFLHSLTMHCSGPNTSTDHHRWHMTMVFNAMCNPIKGQHFHALPGEFNMTRYPANAAKLCTDTTFNDDHEWKSAYDVDLFSKATNIDENDVKVTSES